MQSITLLLLSLVVALNAQWQCQNVCNQIECCDIPSNNQYYLTTFCDSTTACGPVCSDLTYFSADSQRFGCGANLTVCSVNSGTCVGGVIVIDSGPNVSVENEAQMPIIDGSAQICQDLFNSGSCGWSDSNSITAVLAISPTPVGLFKVTPEEMQKMIDEHEAYLKENGMRT